MPHIHSIHDSFYDEAYIRRYNVLMDIILDDDDEEEEEENYNGRTARAEVLHTNSLSSTSNTPLPTPIKLPNKRKPVSRSLSPTNNDGGISHQQVLDAKYAAASVFSSSETWNNDIAKRKRLRELEIENIEYKDKRSAIGVSMKEIRYDMDKSNEFKRLKEQKYEFKVLLRKNEMECTTLEKELKVDQIEVSDSDSD